LKPRGCANSLDGAPKRFQTISIQINDLTPSVDQEVGGSSPPNCTISMGRDEASLIITPINELLYAHMGYDAPQSFVSAAMARSDHPALLVSSD
jgi:hypothetical protein